MHALFLFCSVSYKLSRGRILLAISMEFAARDSYLIENNEVAFFVKRGGGALVRMLS
jgi:hypothetical protein